MHRRTIHAPSDLTSLLVTPADGSKVGLVVHETAIEVRLDVWVLRRDVNLATASGVLQVLEPERSKTMLRLDDDDIEVERRTWSCTCQEGARRGLRRHQRRWSRT